MMGKYFYLCSYPLKIGSIVLPGNWGRILKLYTPNSGNAWLIVREKIFEEIRLSQFSTKPSRLEANFLCENKEDIIAFRKETNRLFDLAYEVEIVNPSLPTHRGCLRFLDIKTQDSNDQLVRNAKAYWNGEDIQKPEIVTPSEICVVSYVEI